MRFRPLALSPLALAFAICSSLGYAAALKTYQVSGPVLEVTDTKIVVQKGKEKWELARDPSTKVDGELKVGSKATISYTMTAATVSSKAEKAPAPAK